MTTEHLVQASLVELGAAQRFGHRFPRVPHVTPGRARLVDEIRERLRDDLLLSRRRFEARQNLVQRSTRAPAAVAAAKMMMAVPAPTPPREHAHEGDEAQRSKDESEHEMMTPSGLAEPAAVAGPARELCEAMLSRVTLRNN